MIWVFKFAKQVVEIKRLHKGTVKLPEEASHYHRDYVGATRTDIKPLDVVQPEGPSFKVSGNLIDWQKWQIRVGFNYREGLVLHQVK